MAKKIEDGFKLSTGKSIYANRSILGIGFHNGKITPFTGFDGGVDEDLTPEEKRELAEYAIGLWKKYGKI